MEAALKTMEYSIMDFFETR